MKLNKFTLSYFIKTSDKQIALLLTTKTKNGFLHHKNLLETLPKNDVFRNVNYRNRSDTGYTKFDTSELNEKQKKKRQSFHFHQPFN